MTSGLCNLKYYIGAFLKKRKYMEVKEEGMEVQEEAALFMLGSSYNRPKYNGPTLRPNPMVFKIFHFYGEILFFDGFEIIFVSYY